MKRLVDEIGARPAAARAVTLKDKYKFKTEMDDEARNAMFPRAGCSARRSPQSLCAEQPNNATLSPEQPRFYEQPR